MRQLGGGEAGDGCTPDRQEEDIAPLLMSELLCSATGQRVMLPSWAACGLLLM